MQTDTNSYDSLGNLDSRPMPKWLIDQQSGLTTIQPDEIHMKEDHALKISSIVTVTFIILVVALLTYYFNRKHKNQAS